MKNLKYILFIVPYIVIIILIIIIFKNNSNNNSNNKKNTTAYPSGVNVPSASLRTNTYNNTSLGYSFKYPSNLYSPTSNCGTGCYNPVSVYLPDGVKVDISYVQYNNSFMTDRINILNNHPTGTINPPEDYITEKYSSSSQSNLKTYFYLCYYKNYGGLSAVFFVIPKPATNNGYFQFSTSNIQGYPSSYDLSTIKQIGESFKITS